MAEDYTARPSCKMAWLFTEGSGDTVADASGEGYTGTFASLNNPAWDTTDVPFKVSGSAPNSADFSTDYIKNTGTPITAAPLTIVGWFNTNSNSADQTIFSIGGANDTSWFRLMIRGSVAGDPVQADINGNSSYSSVNTTTGFTTGTWYHAAVVFASTTSRTVYINGGDSATNTDNRTPLSLTQMAAGRLERTTPVEYFDGKLTEIAIFNEALSQAQIQEIMNYGLTGGGAVTSIRPRAMLMGMGT